MRLYSELFLEITTLVVDVDLNTVGLELTSLCKRDTEEDYNVLLQFIEIQQ